MWPCLLRRGIVTVYLKALQSIIRISATLTAVISVPALLVVAGLTGASGKAADKILALSILGGGAALSIWVIACCAIPARLTGYIPGSRTEFILVKAPVNLYGVIGIYWCLRWIVPFRFF